MNDSSKFGKIGTAEKLLSELHNSLNYRELTAFNIRWSAISEKNAELRVEAVNLGKKEIFQVLVSLHPSRQLLKRAVDQDVKPIVVVSPHIPEDLASDLRKQGVNHADLNGRIFLQADAFAVELQPKGNQYRNPVTEPDLFSLKTSRIVRALLSNRQRAWVQEELVLHTKVSPGLVSRILKTLAENGYVSKETGSYPKSRAGYRLKEFDRLLDAWKSADVWNKRVSVQQYSLLTNNVNEIADTIRDAIGEEKTYFTQWFAAQLRRPHTIPPVVSAYVSSKQKLEIPFARPVASGGNLWLITPDDEGVFFDHQKIEGFKLVSDVQIYLDLLQVGQRGPEQAQELRRWSAFAL